MPAATGNIIVSNQCAGVAAGALAANDGVSMQTRILLALLSLLFLVAATLRCYRDGGRIMIHNARSTSGWGFGHAVHKNDVQYFAWNGRELAATTFEVAVTCRDLNADEEKLRLGSEAAAPTPRSPLDDDEVTPEDLEGGDGEVR